MSPRYILLFGVAFLGLGASPAFGQQPPAPGGVLEGHTKAVVALSFSSAGRKLATASLDGTARVWEVTSKKLLHTLNGHQGPVLAVAFTADGALLATGGADGVVRIWDAATGREQRQLEDHKGKVAALAFTRDGALLATGGYDKTIHLWEPTSGKLVRSLKGQQERVTSLAFTGNGRRLLSGGVFNENIMVGGNNISTGSADSVRLWDVAGGKEQRKFDARGSVVALSADGKVGAVVGLVPDIQMDGMGGTSFDGFDQITVLQPDTGATRHIIKWRGSTLALSADGKWLATGAGHYLHHAGFGMIAHNGVNGKNLDTRLRLWDTASGKETVVIPEEQAAVLAFSADGATLAAGVGNRVQLRSVPALVGGKRLKK